MRCGGAAARGGTWWWFHVLWRSRWPTPTLCRTRPRFAAVVCRRLTPTLPCSHCPAALQLAARTLAEDFADYYSAETDTAGPADPAVRAATVSFLEGIVALDDVSEAFMVSANAAAVDGDVAPASFPASTRASLESSAPPPRV